jgi:multiple sugar transport system permease protein
MTDTAPSTGATGVAEAPPQVQPRRRPARAPLSEGARAERRLGWLLCSPAVIVMLAVTAYPIGYAVYLSLHRYDLRFPAEQRFVGLANYATVLGDGLWWTAFGVTLFITVVSVAVELVLGMGLALIMRRALIGRGAVRTAILIPYGIVTVVAAYSWQYAWTPDTGYLAHLLPAGSAPLTKQWPAIFIIILAEIWKTTPFIALLLLAGLSLVPEELLKAARVDGATRWQRFTEITLPLMKPAILVALLFRTLDAFRIFDNIFIMTAGGNGTRSVSILGYDNLFTALNLGIGSTISVLVFIAVAVIAFIFIKGFGTAAPGQEVGRR